MVTSLLVIVVAQSVGWTQFQQSHHCCDGWCTKVSICQAGAGQCGFQGLGPLFIHCIYIKPVTNGVYIYIFLNKVIYINFNPYKLMHLHIVGIFIQIQIQITYARVPHQRRKRRVEKFVIMTWTKALNFTKLAPKHRIML